MLAGHTEWLIWHLRAMADNLEGLTAEMEWPPPGECCVSRLCQRDTLPDSAVPAGH